MYNYYCPLFSYRNVQGGISCIGENCVLYSRNKNECLVRCALLKYTQNALTEEHPSTEDRLRDLEHKMAIASLGFPVFPADPDMPGLSRRL